MNRSKSRSAARLAAVQASYQRSMEATPVVQLLHEFHHHRLGATIEDVEYNDAEVAFFDDLVSGSVAREAELDAAIVQVFAHELRASDVVLFTGALATDAGPRARELQRYLREDDE